MYSILEIHPTPRYAPKNSILYTKYDLGRIRISTRVPRPVAHLELQSPVPSSETISERTQVCLSRNSLASLIFVAR